MFNAKNCKHPPVAASGLDGILAESVIFLTDVVEYLPRSGDSPVHASTVMRWVRRGCRGVKLEAARLGGRWVTSREALTRFVERLSRPAGPCPPEVLSPGARSRRLAQAELEADAAGF
jgi:hypothetical protein